MDRQAAWVPGGGQGQVAPGVPHPWRTSGGLGGRLVDPLEPSGVCSTRCAAHHCFCSALFRNRSYVKSKLTHHDDIGYVVVAINPHGSTGYGQDFCDSIHSPRNDWGGKPFRDLVAGLQHVLDIYPAVDRERLVAAGGSYGGYMINWLQGHNSHTNFKAMVNHDGVFGKPKRPRQLAAMPYSN
jgi:hypothetical protein